MIEAAPPLDDFLAGAGSSTATGERLQQIGLIGSLIGVTVALGVVVFLAVTHRGSRSEVRMLLRIAGVFGVLVLVGSIVEVAGLASVLDAGWDDALTSGAGAASMMRLMAGLLILLGLFDHVVPTGAHPNGLDFDVVSPPGSAEEVRWVPSAASAFGLSGCAIGVLSFGFDGHTVSEGPRVAHLAADLVHVVAGSVWLGGVVALAVVLVRRRRTGGSVAPLIVRFSSVATVALVAVTVAGSVMAWFVLDGPGELTSTPWGRVLLVKAAVVGVAVAIGGYNHFVVVPALCGGTTASRDGVVVRARRTVTVEAVVLLAVALVTVLLTNASTNPVGGG